MNNQRPNEIDAISKILSANDTGETGGHQAGILIPKQSDVLSFFPFLDRSVKNPRVEMIFYDRQGDEWEFNFIYYNNHFFGGTRNEFRLTGMTKFFRTNNLKAGDKVILYKEDGGRSIVSFERREGEDNLSDVLQLGNAWRVIRL